MANRTIKGVFQLRGDTLANWTSKDPVLKDREVGIVVIPADSASGLNEPAVLLKVGDGTKTFAQLPYVSALAGDVKDWAKAATKPTYTANEISGLSDYIAGEIDDTDTQYKIEQDNTDGHTIKFYSKEKGTEAWKLEATITTVDTTYDDTELSGRVEDAEGDISDLQELVGDEAVATQISKAIAALSTVYDAKGAAAAVLGSDEDTAGDNTVYGANKAAAAAQAEAESKVAGVTAGNDGIEIDNTDSKNPKVKVKIDPDESNALEMGEDGLKVVIPDAESIEVVKKGTATEGYIATYIVTVGGQQVGAEINIPKDYLVKSASIKVVADDDDPYTGAKTGDKYIDFVVNTADTTSGTGNESHIYLAVNELVDTYTAGQGIDISDANVVAIKLDTANANGLAVTDAGLKLNPASAAGAGAMSAADYTKLDGVSEGANKVEKGSENGKVKVDGVDVDVYTLPSTVLDETDTIVIDGGNA